MLKNIRCTRCWAKWNCAMSLTLCIVIRNIVCVLKIATVICYMSPFWDCNFRNNVTGVLKQFSASLYTSFSEYFNVCFVSYIYIYIYIFLYTNLYTDLQNKLKIDKIRNYCNNNIKSFQRNNTTFLFMDFLFLFV